MNNFIIKISMFLILAFSYFNANAQGVSLGKTRVIFSEGSSSESVYISNDDNQPYLIQAGVTEKIDGNLSSNFIVTPPVFRLENRSVSSLRILLKDTQDLPNDKESLFYLNTKIIPSTKRPDESESQESKLVLITNFVIKVIYRPENIARPSEQDYKKIFIKKNEGKWFLDNPTPYYMTLTSIKVNNEKYNKTLLLAPYSKAELVEVSIKEASWHVINDYGELSKELKYKD
ncbi:fimbrial biogenesis chaperone [Proteus terrae]|uniref:Molecular chaperone n=1 Tax=Proteus terrae subsp. cibarius TaxID=626774 RepID=A0A6G6ST89_9GAMM|nr:molecular chaperone [Proteus terrae]QHP75975.1 molecular chaperone [Proteus vulgaris]MBG2916303.1 molecular chaperone [Proteus terrae subsp. cibarius]MBG3089390.1 molecular chaperone [Proteus terrae subsp. cibarius]QIF97752.1 fimbria/pilus periplasmic chaperone [Proteus terrae subsp. cibarius]QUT03136.1 molecular chaperone [Proteus terrae subsp. cibarius]